MSLTAPRIDPTTLPGAENAGKPGFYTVRQGDTIMKIATEVNQPWRDIVRWNNLDNPNALKAARCWCAWWRRSAPPWPPPRR